MKDEPRPYLVYKKSLMVELVRLDNNLMYSTRNRANPKWQVFMFEDNEKLRRDIAMLTGHKYEDEE